MDADRPRAAEQCCTSPNNRRKAKERMRQWYFTRGKDQRARKRGRKRGRGQSLTGTLQAKHHKPDAAGHHAAASHFAPFDPECNESGYEPHVRQYEVFEREEVETIKDIIFDYLNEEKEERGEEKSEKSSVLGGTVIALGTAMVPVLVKTAYESRGAIKNVGSFLGSRLWAQPSSEAHSSGPASTPLSPGVSTELSPPSSSGASDVRLTPCDENVVG